MTPPLRPTPIKNDGTRYDCTLDYDPQTADGLGRFTFTIGSKTHTTQDYGPLPELSEREAQARFPNTTKVTVDLTPGFRKEGAMFDRFGVLNMMKSGGTATMFFDDLQYNGQTQDFAQDPRYGPVLATASPLKTTSKSVRTTSVQSENEPRGRHFGRGRRWSVA